MSARPLREAVVDLEVVARNVETLRALVGTEHFLSVVKANGYGHGASFVARAALAGGADWLGVVDAAEALPLRGAGIAAPILTWLHGPEESFEAHAAHDLDVGISSLDELERAALAGVRWVQLKVDTGLGRNGAEESTWGALFARTAELQASGGPRMRGLFSHLANAGAEADADQGAAFERAREAAASFGLEPELVHLAATEGAIARPELRYSMVRVGLGTYGLSPFGGSDGADSGSAESNVRDSAQPLPPLTPALELSAAVVSVKRVPADSGVSYGHRYRTEQATSLALIPLGYCDGIPRQASNRGHVLLGGERYRVCGTVAMDQFVVDVGDAPVAPGDRAIVWGDPATGAPSATEWAEAAGTINYDLVARIGQRVVRTYRGAP